MEGKPEEFGMGPRGPALINEGQIFSARGEHYLQEKSRDSVLPGQTGGLWLPFLGRDRSYQLTFLRQLENQIGTTFMVIRDGCGGLG